MLPFIAWIKDPQKVMEALECACGLCHHNWGGGVNDARAWLANTVATCVEKMDVSENLLNVVKRAGKARGVKTRLGAAGGRWCTAGGEWGKSEEKETGGNGMSWGMPGWWSESRFRHPLNWDPYFLYANYDSLLRFLNLRSASLRVTRTPYFDSGKPDREKLEKS